MNAYIGNIICGRVGTNLGTNFRSIPTPRVKHEFFLYRQAGRRTGVVTESELSENSCPKFVRNSNSVNRLRSIAVNNRVNRICSIGSRRSTRFQRTGNPFYSHRLLTKFRWSSHKRGETPKHEIPGCLDRLLLLRNLGPISWYSCSSKLDLSAF